MLIKKDLTRTEKSICSYISEGGLTQDEICRSLNIRPSTYRVHLRNIRLKGFSGGDVPPSVVPYGDQDLTDTQRIVLHMRYYQGLSYAQIGKEMGIIIETARVHASMGCRALGIRGRSGGIGEYITQSARKRAVLQALGLLVKREPPIKPENLMDDPMF